MDFNWIDNHTETVSPSGSGSEPIPAPAASLSHLEELRVNYRAYVRASAALADTADQARLAHDAAVAEKLSAHAGTYARVADRVLRDITREVDRQEPTPFVELPPMRQDGGQ